jgi:hypothetical protein
MSVFTFHMLWRGPRTILHARVARGMIAAQCPCALVVSHVLSCSRIVQVKNVTLYVTEMQRSFTDKLSNNFFNEPSQVPRLCKLRFSFAFAVHGVATVRSMVVVSFEGAQ